MSWERYINSNVTGFEVETYSGRVFTPRFYCHDDVGTPVPLYTGKPPVCHLDLVPRVQYIGESQAWDIGDSFSATDTVDVFYIDWGGATDIGDISAADFNMDPTSGSVEYDDLGTYTVEAYVIDVLGVESQHVFITVEIVEPIERLYIATTDSGLFLSDNGSAPAASNGSLSGDDLLLRAARLNPAYANLPAAQQHLYMATAAGLTKSTDGGVTHSTISPATMGTPDNDAGDDPAPATGDLDQIDICFDPQDDSRVYVLRTTTSPKRAWLYISDDHGATWENAQVGT